MNKIRNFFITTLIGGTLVILPIAILIIVFTWIFKIISNIIAPVSSLINIGQQMNEYVVDLLALSIMVVFSFLVGLFIKTQIGEKLFIRIENHLLHKLPLYSTIKETIKQFTGQKKLPFSKIALANIYNNETRVTAFVTDEHQDGTYTVFVPTGPNPTSGNIFHVKSHQLEFVDAPVETAMRSIVSCGSGSGYLIMNKVENDDR